MSNMSYCRFRNTLGDLQDCFDNINEPLDGAEFRARRQLVELCHSIAEYASPDDFTESRLCDSCEFSEAITTTQDGEHLCRDCAAQEHAGLQHP